MKNGKLVFSARCAAALLAFGIAIFAVAEEKKVELKFELPEANYGGTPLQYDGKNLEADDFKPRPPYLAPEGTQLLSRGKPVTSDAGEPRFGKLAFVTDGDKSYKEKGLVGLAPGKHYVQVDLEQEVNIYAILLWHYHEAERVYFHVIVQVSSDATFAKDVKTIFNNDADNKESMGPGKDKEYKERHTGKLIDAKGVKGRYVRFYAHQNTTDELSHYIEAEVWGKPLAAK
jgi:hypothetical protein